MLSIAWINRATLEFSGKPFPSGRETKKGLARGFSSGTLSQPATVGSVLTALVRVSWHGVAMLPGGSKPVALHRTVRRS